ncbi:MAG: flagellar brake protein [Sulfuricella sp.]|nr:flagellar brake protein [Sulfuricella sp.]
MDISPNDASKYLVESSKEVAYILRAIMQRGERITAHFNQGDDMMLTSIIEVDADSEEVILDYGANEALNRKILEVHRVIFITSQDKVRVQFLATRVEKVNFEGRPAFRISLPDSLIKLQRREYFRLATPITKPLICSIPLEEGKKLDISVADISIGGIGIVNPPANFTFDPGTSYQGCHFTLPDIGTIVTTLQIRNAFEVTLKSGLHTWRAGCMFINLPGTMQSMIQRYIIKLERERRALQIDAD